MYVNKFLGRSLQFSNGLSVGFNWVHGNGHSSRTSALLAAWNPSWSLTWRWALYWYRPVTPLCVPKVARWCPAPGSGYGSLSISLPLVGGLLLSWQPTMRRRELSDDSKWWG